MVIARNPYYTAGDIILVTNIVFKDTYYIDIHLDGRPMMILNQVGSADGTIYALKISSRFHEGDDIKDFCIIKPTQNNKLVKEPYVDLRYAYKIRRRDIQCRFGYVDDDRYNKILRRLKIVQDGKVQKDADYKMVEEWYIKSVGERKGLVI